MVNGGDAAEQVVRLSLEGVEVAARITGEGAKNIALILAAVLREEHKTKGKSRLSNMIKSGKELKVFSIQNKDLKKFSQEAKRYGVLYCALKDKGDTSDFSTIDIIARAEDASKISRIMERFKLTSMDKASVVSEVEKDIEARKAKALNPDLAPAEKGSPSGLNSKNQSLSNTELSNVKKPSVRKQLEKYRAELAGKAEGAKDKLMSRTGAKPEKSGFAINTGKPKKKSKSKAR